MAGVGLCALPSSSQERADSRKVKVGWLALGESIYKEPYSQAFLERMRENGFSEGVNLVVDKRHGNGNIDRLESAALDLVQAKPDVIFASGGEAGLLALKKASKSIPSVFVAVDFDPVQAGYFSSISRPEGVLTGVSANQALLPAKRLEILKVLLPRVKKVAVFANPQTAGQLAVVRNAADVLALYLNIHEFKTLPYNFEAAFAKALQTRCDALLVLGSSLFVSARNKLPQLATANRLPSVFHHAQWTEAGGLFSYGYNFPKLWQMGADMVNKVLHGVPIAELPVEFPTTFELAINLTTARLLKIDIPYEMRLRADRFIT